MPASLASQLITLYRRQLGLKEGFLHRHRYRSRSEEDRLTWAAEYAEGEKKAAQIDEALPHVEYVIKMLLPEWDATSIKAMRPRRAPPENRPAAGWTAAVLDAIREAEYPLCAADLRVQLAEQHGLDISTSGRRQIVNRAIFGAIANILASGLVVRIPGSPIRYEIAQH